MGNQNRKSKFDPELAKQVNKEAEEEQRKEALESKLKPKPENDKEQEKEKSAKPSNVSVKNISDFWKIEGVEYRNGIYSVDLAKQLLPSMTQNKLAEYSKKAKAENKFYGADMPLNYSIFKALYKQKNSKEAEEAKKLIARQMIDSWLMTLTRINYKANGLDEVIHNYNQDDEYKINENIVGPDDYITRIKDKNYLKALIGTEDIKEINDVFEWLVGQKAYIWRLNSKPDKTCGRVARFFADSDWANLNCYWGPEYSYSSLGVRFVREAPTKKI